MAGWHCQSPCLLWKSEAKKAVEIFCQSNLQEQSSHLDLERDEPAPFWRAKGAIDYIETEGCWWVIGGLVASEVSLWILVGGLWVTVYGDFLKDLLVNTGFRQGSGFELVEWVSFVRRRCSNSIFLFSQQVFTSCWELSTFSDFTFCMGFLKWEFWGKIFGEIIPDDV